LLAVWNWISSDNAYLEIQGSQLRARLPFSNPENWREFCQKLNPLWPRPLSDAVKLPQSPLAHFTDKARLQELFEVLEWATEQIEHQSALKDSA